jgi:IS5 family transposase
MFKTVDNRSVLVIHRFVFLAMIRKSNLPSLVDVVVEHRKIPTELFDRVNLILEKVDIETELQKYYQKGRSVDGRESYHPVVLFKMLLLQFWYGLSDVSVEENVRDSISFSRFCGISMDEKIPDSTVLCRFRGILSKQNAFEKLLALINNKMEQGGLIVNKGIIVDASVTVTQRKPRGKKEYEVCEDRKEDENVPAQVPKAIPQRHVDQQAAWLKKGGKLLYGYKQHTATNQEGFVLAIHTTAANESDIKNLEPVLNKLNIAPRTPVYADKGYACENNNKVIQEKRLKNRILYKAFKNKPITEIQKQINKKISQTRYKVERTFGSMKRWFKSNHTRYVGLEKTHSQHNILAICYNLYRQPIVH